MPAALAPQKRQWTHAICRDSVCTQCQRQLGKAGASLLPATSAPLPVGPHPLVSSLHAQARECIRKKSMLVLKGCPSGTSELFSIHKVVIKKEQIMGGWKLEAAKMAIYLSFPVAMFHFFNQPEYFEEWVIKTRRELYPPESAQHRKQIQEFAEQLQRKRDVEMLKALEQAEKK
ncbi:uncharacterized protein LOC126279123 isoform X3 [Schistocerca gregaria]|nr:uncharacterized protein LOC126279123 isoform X3 [Schistocerca gregaria]